MIAEAGILWEFMTLQFFSFRTAHRRREITIAFMLVTVTVVFIICHSMRAVVSLMKLIISIPGNILNELAKGLQSISIKMVECQQKSTFSSRLGENLVYPNVYQKMSDLTINFPLFQS